MDAGTMVGLLVAVLAFVLGTWGASLVVRALASRASRFSPRWRRRVPKPLHITPPKLSRLQFWFGMLAGPPVFAAGTALALFVAGEVLTERDDINPLFFSGAIVLLMLGLGTMIVGFRWDRANGRRRCPKCWYDYTGLDDSAACPECGRVPRGARALLRTRRSGLMMRFGAVILLGAWATFVAPRAIMTEGRSLIPTTVLIGAFERLPDGIIFGGPWGDDGSLQARLSERKVSQTQAAWLHRRCLRFLKASDDPRTCAFAATLLERSAYGGGDPRDPTSMADVDEANANLLGVMLAASGDPKHLPSLVGIEPRCVMSTGPKTKKFVEDHIEQLLSRYAAASTSSERLAYGRLIARLAPRTPEVAAAARKAALDPALVELDHFTACVVFGMVVRGDPDMIAQLEQDFDAASGTTREALAVALLASRTEPAPVFLVRYLTTDPNADADVLRALDSEDAALRNGGIAYLRVARSLTDIWLDTNVLTPKVREIATRFPESRVRALEHLAGEGQLGVESIPELVLIAKEGTAAELAQLSGWLSRVWMDTRWIPLHEAVAARLADPTLGQASIDALEHVQAMMKRHIPSLR